jgi:hypothetical protein
LKGESSTFVQCPCLKNADRFAVGAFGQTAGKKEVLLHFKTLYFFGCRTGKEQGNRTPRQGPSDSIKPRLPIPEVTWKSRSGDPLQPTKHGWIVRCTTIQNHHPTQLLDDNIGVLPGKQKLKIRILK